MVIGIAGGSGSGKTTLALRLLHVIGQERCAILEQDSYYRDQSKKFGENHSSVNFDDPSAIDFELLVQQLRTLKAGQSIDCPIYDFKSHSRRLDSLKIEAKPVIIIDGILIYTRPELVKEIDLKFFIETPEPVRFERRLRRDIRERGRSEKEVTEQFYSQVKAAHDAYVEPSKKFADYIIRT